MHQPRPHGTFGAATEEDAAAAELLARRLTNLKQQSGLSSLRMARTLPSGAIAIAQDMGGVFKVIIQPRIVEQPAEAGADGLASSYIPMMFSGAIDRGTALHGEGIRVRLTAETRRRLGGYDPKRAAAVADTQVLQRFVIELSQRFFELMPIPPPETYTFTQYANLRPTWYSGAMAEVVQIVGGYGRLALNELPDTPVERARMALPPGVTRAIEQQLGNRRLPGYTGFPPIDGQIRYDYKFNETHGVGFDTKQRPWLLRVGPAGVYAMPLPLIPATTTKAFREFVEYHGDDELKWVLDRFGGMPSGESFPAVAADFQAWRRAGVIVKVCDVGDFYQHLMYGSAMGWSFNSRGSEGFNTCYDFEPERRQCSSLAYKLKLQLGAAEGDGKLPPSFEVNDPDDARALNAYLSKLYEALPGERARSLAIRYKLGRTPVAEILERAVAALRTGANVQAEVDYWDNLEAPPIATHAGSVSRVGAGPIDWQLPGFKFPEPFLQGCISFEGPARQPAAFAAPRADTILAGYYVGDSLKVVKFFKDDRGWFQEGRNNYEECMTIGSWEQTVTTGSSTLMGNFYTSDFDDREAAADTTEITRIVGTDLGYDHTPFFSFDDFFWRPGTLWRNRYIKHRTSTETTRGYSRAVAVCLPYLDRNAVLHVRSDSHSGKTTSEATSLFSIADPWTYRYWTNDFIWAWIGGVAGPQAKVPVYPKDGNPVWVVQQNYAPGVCSDFADQGPWIPGLPADFTWLIHPNKGEWRHSGGGGPPSVNEGSTSTTQPGRTEGRINFSSLGTPLTLMAQPASTYFLKSPDQYVGVFYRDAIKVAAGECEYASVSEAHPSLPGARAFQGWCRLADHKAAHHFIGVING